MLGIRYSHSCVAASGEYVRTSVSAACLTSCLSECLHRVYIPCFCLAHLSTFRLLFALNNVVILSAASRCQPMSKVEHRTATAHTHNCKPCFNKGCREYSSTIRVVNYSSNFLLRKNSLIPTSGCKFPFPVAVFLQSIDELL